MIQATAERRQGCQRAQATDGANEPAGLHDFALDDIPWTGKMPMPLKDPGQFVDIFHHIDGAVIVTDLQGVVVFWNPAAERIFEVPALEAQGTSLSDHISAEMWARMQSGFSGLLQKRYFHGECQVTKRSGEVIWLDCQVNVLAGERGLPSAVLTISYDITDRKLREFERQESALHLGAIVNSVDDVIISFDEGLRIVFLNSAAERAFGCLLSEAHGLLAAEIPALAAILGQLRPEELLNGQTNRSVRHVEHRRPEGHSSSLEAVLGAVLIHGRRFITAIIRDVSHQKQMERALFQSQKVQAIGSLASGVAHDFNNILTAILSHLDLVVFAPELPQNCHDHLLCAKTSARRGAELVSKLLTFSRQSEPKLTRLNLVALAEEVVFMLRRSIDHRIQISLNAVSNPTWLVLADGSQLMQVMINLCLNARDAMPNGGELKISIENLALPADVAARTPAKIPEHVRLTVSDTGEGIPPEVRERLFEPYFTTKEVGRGTGLGLSIAQSVVGEHQGWMEVESAVGRGSAFHVYLPHVSEAEQEGETKDSLGSSDGSLEGKETILVVDDEEIVRLVLKVILTYRGYQVAEAKDGFEAMDKYCENPAGFDIVLADLNMPRMNGWELLKNLIQFDADVPVILLSGGMTEGMDERARELGAAAMLVKPFENLELLRIVRRTLDRAKALRR